MKTASFTVDWLLSTADRDRLGGPYLIIKLTRLSLKKADIPVLALVETPLAGLSLCAPYAHTNYHLASDPLQQLGYKQRICCWRSRP